MRPVGSTARAAFAEAHALLEVRGVELGSTRPAFDLTMPAPAGAEPSGASALDGRGPLHDAARALRAGETTARALVERALDAVDAHDAGLHALAHVDATRARAEADALDAEAARTGWRGPLHGIPITVKDVIDVEGMPTRAGSDAYFALPETDAPSVARLRAAGAIVVGKAVTHEFALGVTTPQSRNPHDPGRIPGGSSGGSAISVATGMCLASLGTDTRASIRAPAALSGVVGLKPTYGRVPSAGIVSLSWTMDHVAPMASSVADVAVVLEALTGSAGLTPAVHRGVAGLRVGVAPAPFDGAQAAVRDAVERAVDRLAERGADIVAVDRPSSDDLDLASAAGLLVSRCEAASMHRSLGLDRSRYWEEVAEQLEEGTRIAAVDYLDAQRLRATLVRDLGAVFEKVDVLAMPTAAVVAPPLDDFAQYLMLLARNAIPWSFVGFPAISVPCRTGAGLPVGLQLVAAPYRDDRVVAAAAAVE